MTWTIDDVDNAEGDFGYTLYGKTGVLYRQASYHETKSGFVGVDGEVDRIEFYTPTNHGLHILIDIKQDGVEQNYVCGNCRADSSSVVLGRLYLDGDMNGPTDLTRASNCQKACEFRKVRLPQSKSFAGKICTIGCGDGDTKISC